MLQTCYFTADCLRISIVEQWRRFVCLNFFEHATPRSKGVALLSRWVRGMYLGWQQWEKSKTQYAKISQSLAATRIVYSWLVERAPFASSFLLRVRTYIRVHSSRIGSVLTFILRILVTHRYAHSRPSHGDSREDTKGFWILLFKY